MIDESLGVQAIAQISEDLYLKIARVVDLSGKNFEEVLGDLVALGFQNMQVSQDAPQG